MRQLERLDVPEVTGSIVLVEERVEPRCRREYRSDLVEEFGSRLRVPEQVTGPLRVERAPTDDADRSPLLPRYEVDRQP